VEYRVKKAFLLVAGLGTRLQPLTNRVPKCLVPIRGTPLLRIWFDICERLGVEEVLMNTHHLAEVVETWVKQETTRLRVHLYHEKILLGSAGTVAANREFVGTDQDFYVFYGDNLMCADLSSFTAFHMTHPGVLTVGLFQPARPESCGIVTLDASGCVTHFEEKPDRPQSNLANAGIYIARRSLFDFLPRNGFADFGRDVMPGLVGRMWGRLLGGYLLDIGTFENYQRAQEDWPGLQLGVSAT